MSNSKQIKPLKGILGIIPKAAGCIWIFSALTGIILMLQRLSRSEDSVVARLLPWLHEIAQYTLTISIEHVASGFLLPFLVWGAFAWFLGQPFPPSKPFSDDDKFKSARMFLHFILEQVRNWIHALTARRSPTNYHVFCCLTALIFNLVLIYHEGKWELQTALFITEDSQQSKPLVAAEKSPRIKVLEKCMATSGNEYKALISCMEKNARAELMQLRIFSLSSFAAVGLIILLHWFAALQSAAIHQRLNVRHPRPRPLRHKYCCRFATERRNKKRLRSCKALP